MWDLIVSVPDHCLSFYFPCHQPPQKLQICCGALQRHSILLTVCLMCVCHLLVLCSYSVCLFVFVRLVVLMTVDLMINSFCFANRPAVVHWLVVHWLLTMK